MPDPARVAQGMALEIPVTIQGSQTAEGTGRELFTENAKTTLTFDNGAILNLQSRVKRGQSLFLRNEQSGRETICRVVEAPREGEAGYTELEFITPNPEFWGGHAENVAAAPQQSAPEQESTAQQTRPAPDALAMMSQNAATAKPSEFTIRKPFQEELVPAHEAVPTSSSSIAPPLDQSRGPTREQIDAALQRMAALLPAPSSQGRAEESSREPHDAELDAAKDAQHLAALMARDAKRARRAGAESPTEVQKVERGAGAQANSDLATEGKAGAAATVVARSLSLREMLAAALETLTTGKGLIASEMAVVVIILVAAGFLWRAVTPLFSPGNDRPAAAPISTRQKLPTSAMQPAQGAAAISASSDPTAPPVTSKTSNIGNSNGGGALNTLDAVNPAPKSTPFAAKPSQSSGKLQSAAAIPKEPSATTAAGSGQATQTDPSAANAHGITPARIVWKVQPGFPSWAKKIDVGDAVVTLDALIDEHGDVAQSRVLSGPRALQHAAQQAVGLWIITPAEANGKPVATHMILTVEFQR